MNENHTGRLAGVSGDFRSKKSQLRWGILTGNKRILLSSVSVFASLALAAGATFAFFSDSGTSNDNVFTSGTFDLKLSDDTPETDQDSVTASFGGTGLAPGQCLASQQLRVKNSGTIAGNHVEVRAVNTVADTGTAATPDMDSYLRFQTFNYDGADVTGQFADSNSNTFKDLNDFAASTGLDGLALTNLNTNHNIDVVVCLDSSAPNTVQGDSVDSDWTVELNQDASQ